MATIKDNWTMPARVGKACDDCGEVWQAYAWINKRNNQVCTIATCDCDIMDVPWPLNELTANDFQLALESVGFKWVVNPNDPLAFNSDRSIVESKRRIEVQ